MNRLAAIAALIGFVSVALGAFGAHALDLSPQAQGWFDTATLYGLTHAGLVLAVSMGVPVAAFRWPLRVMLIGAMIFCATLYAMGLGAPRWLGAITPVGGTLLLISWAWLALAALKQTKP
jgi:uncharacterized membrane protein YgdD (TMEM256/DUF423 family)